tara:strand:+ start:6243 stop:9191 length:2949 start_codon:yes stop_codon:yes gene_type:complete
MRKQKVLMRRVNKLLENKSNKFKRKYFLLSALANTNIRNNSDLFSEAKCYANVLIETNGQKPSEEFLVKINKEAISLSKNKNVDKEINFIKNYNDMINSKTGMLKESIIDEELSNISNNNYKLNNKLLSVLIESIEKKKSLLTENEEEKTVESFEELEQIIDAQSKSIESLHSEEFKEEDIHADFGSKEKESFKADPKKISLKKLGFERDKYVVGVKGKARLSALEKAGRKAILRIKGLSNRAKRKFDIIRQIHFYLNVQQKLNMSKIENQGKVDLTKSTERFSSRPSGLPEDDVNDLRKQLDSMLLRHRNYEDLNLEDDTIKERELITLLKKSAGNMSDDAQAYIEYLNRYIPLNPEPEREPLPEDPSFASDMSALDLAQYSEDERAKIAAGIDPETGQPLYEPDVGEVARMSREQSMARQDELPPQEEISAEDAFRMLDDKLGGYSKVKKTLDKISPELSNMIDDPNFTLVHLEKELEKIQDQIDPDDLQDLENIFDSINDSEVINIKILPPKSKADIRSELYDAASTPEDFAFFVSKFVDTNKPLTLRDLGALMSHGEEGIASDANAVRQGLTKSWFRAMFFSFDQKQKANVYATLASKYFKTMELLDLFKDDKVKIPGQKDLSGTGASRYFDVVKKTMTTPIHIENYLTDEFTRRTAERSSLDLDQTGYKKDLSNAAIIDTLLTGNNSFRVFVTSLMKDYYNNNVWNKCESDLAYAVKDYFAQNYARSEIGKDLPPKSKGAKKLAKSRNVKPEQGKDLFNPIIYAVMGRTGIKDKKGTLATPDQMIEERKQAFKKGTFMKKVAKFGVDFTSNRLISRHGAGSNFNDQDLDDLLDDMFNPSGIIGGTFSSFQRMDKEEYKSFITWADSLKEKSLLEDICHALIIGEANSILKGDEFKRPSKIDTIKVESLGRLKEYTKAYKQEIDEQRRDLGIEDAEFVKWQGKKCEIDDVDMTKKIAIIYDENDEEHTVPFSELSLIK